MDDSFVNKTGTQLHNASRGLRANARIASEHTRTSLPPVATEVLVLSGIILDTVAQVVDRVSTWEDVGDPRSAAWMEWRRVALQERRLDLYGTRSAHIDARATSHICADFEALLQFGGVNAGPGDCFPGTGNGKSISSVDCNDSEEVRSMLVEWLRKWNSFRVGKKSSRRKEATWGSHVNMCREETTWRFSGADDCQHSPGALGYSPSWRKMPAFSHGRYCCPNLEVDWW